MGNSKAIRSLHPTRLHSPWAHFPRATKNPGRPNRHVHKSFSQVRPRKPRYSHKTPQFNDFAIYSRIPVLLQIHDAGAVPIPDLSPSKPVPPTSHECFCICNTFFFTTHKPTMCKAQQDTPQIPPHTLESFIPAQCRHYGSDPLDPSTALLTPSPDTSRSLHACRPNKTTFMIHHLKNSNIVTRHRITRQMPIDQTEGEKKTRTELYVPPTRPHYSYRCRKTPQVMRIMSAADETGFRSHIQKLCRCINSQGVSK